MGVDVTTEVQIQRTRRDVAAVMFDPRQDTAWTNGVVASKSLTEGPLRAGSRVERLSRFLGREFTYQYEVVAMDPERFVELRVEQPFPMVIRYELDDTREGTTARIHARGDASTFFSIAAPLLAPMVRRSIARDLAALRDHLHGQPAPAR